MESAVALAAEAQGRWTEVILKVVSPLLATVFVVVSAGCSEPTRVPPARPSDPYDAFLRAYEESVTSRSLEDYLTLHLPDFEVVLPPGLECAVPWLRAEFWEGLAPQGCSQLLGFQLARLSQHNESSGDVLTLSCSSAVLFDGENGALSDIRMRMTVQHAVDRLLISRVEVLR